MHSTGQTYVAKGIKAPKLIITTANAAVTPHIAIPFVLTFLTTNCLPYDFDYIISFHALNCNRNIDNYSCRNQTQQEVQFLLYFTRLDGMDFRGEKKSVGKKKTMIFSRSKKALKH